MDKSLNITYSNMCWTGHLLSDRHVATKDIPVYKIITHNGWSYSGYYNYFAYAPRNTYHVTGGLHPHIIHKDSGYCRVEQGFHSYSANNTRLVLKLNEDCETHHAIIYVDDLTTYIDGYDERCGGRKIYLMACTIPKGAEYYENNNGEIVSETIYVKEIISFSDSRRCLDNFGYEHGIKLKWVIV